MIEVSISPDVLDSAPPLPPCEVRYLGQVDYMKAWDLQRAIGDRRATGSAPDTLLLLEHPHTYTLGRIGNPNNILLSEPELASRGARVYRVDRGGDVTYHGPGQLVGYPVLLVPDRPDVLGYIRDIEEVLIRTLAEFDVRSGRLEGLSGVWIGHEKIAAIGVKMGRVTSHGFALNVATDLSYFGHIIPCGIRDKGVTSMERVNPALAGVRLESVVEAVARNFGEVFARDMAWIESPPST